ncbi:NAD-dependent epimerase/dehydratase family protein [Bacillus sp. DJP31]|uniref:NAD-dependent epimerase/dehydratase family protein n=1 Tax=Bacillus sp. DJP31 TaxID=3409789 RepID=UPI003BB673F7
MKTALVLGGTMFFGKRLVQLLLSHEVEVTIATRGQAADPFGDGVKRIELDRAKKETIQQGLQGKKWDVVYDQTAYSPLEVKDVLDVVKRSIKQYVFTSTMAVYEFGLQHVEENFDPATFQYDLKDRTQYPGLAGYQEAKRACEAYLLENSPVPVSIVRFPLVVGPDDYTNRLKVIVDRAQNGQQIGIHNLDYGLGFISSEKASQFLFWLGENDKVGVWNAALDGQWTHRQLVSEIEKATGKKADVIESDEWPIGIATPYSMRGSWSICAFKAKQSGFNFGKVEEILIPLIESYASKN